MEEDSSESNLNNEPQSSRTEEEQDSVQDTELEPVIQDQENQSLQQDQVQEEATCQDQAELDQGLPGPPEDQGPDHNHCDGGGASEEGSDHHPLIQAEDQDEVEGVDLKTELPQAQAQDQDQAHDQAQAQDQDQAQAQDQDQDQAQAQEQEQEQDQNQINGAANQEACGESGGGVPALVITQVEEAPGPGSRVAPGEPVEAVEPQRPQRPADLLTPLTLLTSPTSPIPLTPLTPTDPSPSSSSDGGDMSCSDLFSLRSDSISLASDPTLSRASEDEDCRSVAASSVMSLFHRIQLDPLEKDWLKSSAVGNLAAQRQLLAQDSSLVLKKDFITTALHWAAKQGRQEVVDMMLRSGADVNARSGYTALHLASIHGHQHIVLVLINKYNAKTNVRDYHGKTALHYWSGNSDIFTQRDSQSGGRLNQGRQSQRYGLPSLLLRSLSQGQLSLPQAASQDVLELYI